MKPIPRHRPPAGCFVLSNPLCHWRAWFSSGTLFRGRWLSRRGAVCLNCPGISISTRLVDVSCRAVIRSKYQSDGRLLYPPQQEPPQQVSAYAGTPPPPGAPWADFRTSRRSLTARVARLAGAFAFSAWQAAGSVWRRLSPRSFIDHRNRLGTPFPDSPSLNRPPALPVNPAHRWCRLILKEPHARAA